MDRSGGVAAFAEKVERLCKHLTQDMEPCRDRDALEELGEWAADVAAEGDYVDPLAGVADALR